MFVRCFSSREARSGKDVREGRKGSHPLPTHENPYGCKFALQQATFRNLHLQRKTRLTNKAAEEEANSDGVQTKKRARLREMEETLSEQGRVVARCQCKMINQRG